jgi:hypothetical protein
MVADTGEDYVLMKLGIPTVEDQNVMFEDRVKELAEKRERAAGLDAAAEALRQQWEKEHEELLDEVTKAKTELAEADYNLRLAVIAHYVETGEKKPHPKLGIRVSRPVKIIDEAAALRYAKEHLPALVVLDTTGFKQYAKGCADIEPIMEGLVGIVDFEEKVTATIAKDLED